MKKLVLTFIVAAFTLYVSGCGKKPDEKNPDEKRLVFAFVPKLLDNPVFQVA